MLRRRVRQRQKPGALGSEIARLEVPPDESPSLRSECQRDQPAKGADPTAHPHQIAYAKSPQGAGARNGRRKPERSRSHGTRRPGSLDAQTRLFGPSNRGPSAACRECGASVSPQDSLMFGNSGGDWPAFPTRRPPSSS